MCGIAGVFSTAGAILGVQPLLAMSKAMARRGPDDEGYVIVDSDGQLREYCGPSTPNPSERFRLPDTQIDTVSGAAGILFLAHRRLAIRDLSPLGHQPMPDRSGRYWLIYNGELYNAGEIEADLRTSGFRAGGNSDTELLINAFAAWGPDALARLNGMFAFAVWDRQKRRLFLARDRLGIKPVYYWHDQQRGLFVFGSDIKTLLASGFFEAAIDPEGLYHALSFGVAPRPMTAFREIRSLRPGHWMTVGVDGDVTIQRWWQLPTGQSESNFELDDAIEGVRHNLFDAVGRQLVADTEVGIYMSGGIDSTSVVAAAASHQPGIRAITLGYTDSEEEDETKEAAAFAELHPVKHEVERVSPESALTQIDEAVLCFEEPCALFAPNYGIAKMAADRSLKVVLSGLGGDELFGGYGRYEALKVWKWSRRLRLFATLFKAFGERGRRIAEFSNVPTAYGLHGHLLGGFPDATKKSLIADVDMQDLNTLDRLRELYIPDDIEFSDDFEAMSYMDIVHYIGNHHCYRVDQFTMRFSIEGRFPLLDHRFVEAAFRLPSAVKIRNGERKWILRRAMEPYLHASNLSMKKRGFSLPSDDWLRHGLLEELKTRTFSRLKERNLFLPEKIDLLLDRFEKGNIPATVVLRLMAVELWIEAFIDGSPSADAEIAASG